VDCHLFSVLANYAENRAKLPLIYKKTNRNRLFVEFLLRQAAQKQAVKAENGLKNVTNCIVIVHITNYTKAQILCNLIFPDFSFFSTMRNLQG